MPAHPDPFRDADGPLVMWTLYKHPLDYPDAFVLRRTCIYPGRVEVDLACLLFDTLLQARLALVLEHLAFLPRHPDDDPVIVGTWV